MHSQTLIAETYTNFYLTIKFEKYNVFFLFDSSYPPTHPHTHTQTNTNTHTCNNEHTKYTQSSAY